MGKIKPKMVGFERPLSLKEVRDEVITAAYERGHSGKTDLAKHNSLVAEINLGGEYYKSARSGSKKARGAGYYARKNIVEMGKTGALKHCDLLFGDMPRPDITKVKNKAEKNVWLWGDPKHIPGLMKEYNRDFTVHEQQAINVTMGVEGLQSAAGEHYYVQDAKLSHISINPSYVDGDTIAHELIHARRRAQGQRNQDRDVEEIQTSLEALVRRPEGGTDGSVGYYQDIRLPDGKSPTLQQMREAMKKDKALLTGMGKAVVGKRAAEIVRKNWVHTQLFTAGPQIRRRAQRYRKPTANAKAGARDLITGRAENYERAFLLVLKDGSQVDVDVIDPRNGLEGLMRDFRNQYPGQIKTVYEWKDGKKVRIYG